MPTRPPTGASPASPMDGGTGAGGLFASVAARLAVAFRMATFNGTPQGDTHPGPDDNAGDDLINGNGGTDVLDGGAGSGILQSAGRRSDCVVSRNGNGSYTAVNPFSLVPGTSLALRPEVDTFSKVETIHFADGYVKLNAVVR